MTCLAQPVREVIARDGIDPTLRQAVEGSLAVLSHYPANAFSAALAFHIADALFYSLTPPALLLSETVSPPRKGMETVKACLFASNVDESKGKAR
jgi:hypothetical protein